MKQIMRITRWIAACCQPVGNCAGGARNRSKTPSVLVLLALLAAPSAHADGPGSPHETGAKDGHIQTANPAPPAVDEERFSDKLREVSARVADRFLEDLKPEFPKRNPYLQHVYTYDLGLEALLELGEVTGEAKWKAQVFEIIDERGITPHSLLPYQSQPFVAINFAMFKATGDYAWLPVFVRESEIWRREARRSPEGAVLMYSRGNTDLYFLVGDNLQEYASRMARCGKHTGDRTYYTEAVAQFRIARSILRNEGNGLYWLGRGWILEEPDKLAPGAWSRGHGWLLKGMVETLSLLPRESQEFAELKDMFIEVVDALVPIQQPSGMWHTLLHRSPDESVAESSGTAMIATAFSRAYREGILDDDRLEKSAIKAFRALSHYVDNEGRVLSVSPGPGPLGSEERYIRTEFKPGETHGPFSMIFATAEAIRLENFVRNPKAKEMNNHE